MNLKNILTEIEKVDPEVYERMDTRRNSMKRFAFAGKVLAAAAIPFAFGGMFKKAYGQSTGEIVDVLNFALTLEYLEAEFYKQAVASAAVGTASAADKAALTLIRDHEIAHVAFLRAAIMPIGTPVSFTANDFDFSGGNGSGTGPFATAFVNYDLLLAVAQVFEDTGVRAYKGQAANLMSNNDVLTAALRIHSVEARHAAKIRYMRKNKPSALVTGNIQPWIIGKMSNIEAGAANAAIQPSYDGEEITTQATVDIVGIGGTAVTAEDASGAFDEPLTKAQVLAIVDPFIK
ncbi:MAG: ferritin-like domain-containing protein [Chitinophagaceae bacterium]|nr:ferritin-like domain-containing protein [Chitinophagaceae bacterium]